MVDFVHDNMRDVSWGPPYTITGLVNNCWERGREVGVAKGDGLTVCMTPCWMANMAPIGYINTAHVGEEGRNGGVGEIS